MAEARIVATLVKPTGERIVAKEKTALEEIQKLQEQIEKKKDEALEELKSDLAEARKVVKDIEDQIEALGGKAGKSSGTRKPKRCSICVGQGKSGEGHTKRTHAAWLKDQK